MSQRKAKTRHPLKLTMVEDDRTFEASVSRMSGAHRLAFDTEAASFHRYFDRVFLIQISSDSESWVIDPLRLSDLTPVGGILADSNVEIVFHDADFDLRNLDRDYGFRVRNMFDTRIAAQLAGEPNVGLGSLLEKFFGVKLDKKFQRADWSMRPLSRSMVSYAVSDTEYLLRLRDRLAELLEKAGRLSWAAGEFKRLEAVEWEPPNTDAPAFLRIKGAKTLERESLGILKALYDWRDCVARSRDRPPFRIMGDQMLLAVAKRGPKNAAHLREADIPKKIASRYGKELISAVKVGLENGSTVWPAVARAPKPKNTAAFDRRVSRLKALRDERARKLELPAGVLCPNGTLQAIARSAPSDISGLKQVSELRTWQRKAIGDKELLSAVRGSS